MFATQRLVLPKLPTILANRTHVDLPGYDIWVVYICMIWIVPTVLDVPKFEDALSKALQLYPHATGQLRCVDGRWSIELTNTAVPIDTDYSKLDTTSDAHLQGDWIGQDDLSPFFSPQPTDVDMVNGSAPLLRFKLTFCGHETCIGISWQHSLGDILIMYRFMHTVSQFYQGLSPTFVPPTFEKYHFPSPTHSTMARLLPYMPQYIDAASARATYANVFKSLGHVRWRIDNQELEELRSALSSNGKGKLLSKQHCLVAYLAAVLNHCQRNLIRHVRNVFAYRDANVPFLSENVASTLVAEIISEVSTNIAQTATAIRDAAVQGRQLDYIYDWESVICKLTLDAANSGKMKVPDYEDSLLVNALDRVDLCNAHFGCPDGTRYHFEHPLHQLRIFKPNSAKGDDGAWQARQSIEISMGVPVNLKPMVEETLARGVQYILNKQRARL